MEKLHCVYNSYIDNFKCKYNITKATKQFVDNGDKIDTFGIIIDEISSVGNVIKTTKIENVGINKRDVEDCINRLRKSSRKLKSR